MTKTKTGTAHPSGTRSIYFSKVVDKGLRILDLFRPEAVSLSLKQIVESTGINQTSAFRFIDTLVQLGYLQKDPKTKLIKLGPKALSLSLNISASFDLLQIVRPLIDEAYREFNVTIDSAVLDDVSLVRLYRREARDTLIFKLPLILPASVSHCMALGKACLSAMAPEAYARAVAAISFERRTPHSLTSLKALEADLERTRQRGYSINNEEYAEGLISIGAPLRGAERRLLGAVSFDFPSVGLSRVEAEKRYAPAVVRLAAVISASLS